MPTAIVGLHLALAAAIVALGLSFLLDPCGGGGDLCLGGIAALAAIAAAGIVLIGLAVWKLARRASLLLAWDAMLLAVGIAFYDAIQYGAPVAWIGSLTLLGLGTPGAILAGRAVASRRIERLIAIGFFIAVAVVLPSVRGLSVAGAGLVALTAGWLTRRLDPGVQAGTPAPPSTPPMSAPPTTSPPPPISPPPPGA